MNRRSRRSGHRQSMGALLRAPGRGGGGIVKLQPSPLLSFPRFSKVFFVCFLVFIWFSFDLLYFLCGPCNFPRSPPFKMAPISGQCQSNLYEFCGLHTKSYISAPGHVHVVHCFVFCNLLLKITTLPTCPTLQLCFFSLFTSKLPAHLLTQSPRSSASSPACLPAGFLPSFTLLFGIGRFWCVVKMTGFDHG